MNMLENISSKIDIIQEQLDFIILNQQEIEKALKLVPQKTVEQLYKSDLEGLFIILREKIEAYIIEKEQNKLSPKKENLIFDKILIEIQITRARIFGINNFLNIPLISTCLHFELFCMVLASQPQSYINTTLRSYKNWIEKNKVNIILKKYEELYDLQSNQITEAANFTTYTKCLSIFSNGTLLMPELKPTDMGYGMTDVNARVNFTLHKISMRFNYVPEQTEAIQSFIDKKYLDLNLLPTEMVISSGYKAIKPFEMTIMPITYKANAPITIQDDFIINENSDQLFQSIKCEEVNAFNNLPVIPSKYLNLPLQGQELLMYTSLLDISNETLVVIDNFLGNSFDLSKNNITDFAYRLESISRIKNKRAMIWVSYLNEVMEQIEEKEKQLKIADLRFRMAALIGKSEMVVEDYISLENELATLLPVALLEPILKLLAPIGKELEIGINNILKEHDLFIENLKNNLEKALQDVERELIVAVENTGEAIEACAGFVENQFESYGQILTEAEKRIEEGKIIDALWHIGTDHIKHTEDNAAIAFMESSLLTSLATAAASIYGAPYGGAAFAAWLTYKQTGDLNLALKTAAITYLTQKSLNGVKGIEGSSVSYIAKRTLISTAIGAASIAASGGSEKDIIDGFLKGAALNLANEYYKYYIHTDINEEIPTKDAIDKEALKDKYGILQDKEGNPILKKILDDDGNEKWITQIDPSKIPADIPQVGLANNNADFFSGSEHSFPMQQFAKIPGFNAMARFHDQWCAVNQVGDITVKVTIIPAIALTVVGRNQFLVDQMLEILNNKNN